MGSLGLAARGGFDIYILISAESVDPVSSVSKACFINVHFGHNANDFAIKGFVITPLIHMDNRRGGNLHTMKGFGKNYNLTQSGQE